ncbi:MAG: YggT family protein [Parvibaculales bacterium]
MEDFMYSVLTLISRLIDFYSLIIFASVIMSWLVAFDIVNIRNRFVYNVAQFINQMTEPLFRQIRRVLPPIGGLDLSPIIVIFGLWFIRDLLWEIFG